MAVFSFIGATIASAVGLTGSFITIAGIGLSATGALVASVVAGGLAYATAKVTGAFDIPGQDLGPDPGVKIQVAPSTDNRIGIPYGRNTMGGPITDVAISNNNQTMTYIIVLGEAVDGATYTLNEVYKNADTCNFDSGGVLTSITEQGGTVNSDLAGKIRVGLYAGDPISGKFFGLSGGAYLYLPHATNSVSYSLQDLVYAIVQIDYDAENGLTGLPPMSFDITNSISNPGDVLIDYLNNDRYGAGLSNTLIDVNSITDTANTAMKGYCAEQITYTPNTGGSSTIDRWEINGYINTANDVATNINKICQAAATFFTFDNKQGKFKAVPNRPTSSTFSLNDDNIVSKIQITSTELYSLFNKAEIVFADKNKRDQSNSLTIETPSGDLNPNEPENIVKYRIDLINNNIHAENLANLDLTQSRKGMVVQCTGDFSCMQIDVGDVVDLTNEDYGFSAKEFRVLRTKEVQEEGGIINVQLSLLEYEPNAYVIGTVTESDDAGGNVDIPVIPPGDIVPPNIFSGIVTNVDTFDVSPSGGTGAVFSVFKNVLNGTYGSVYPTTAGSGYSVGDTITVDGKYLRGFSGTHNLSFTVDTIDGGGGVIAPTGNVSGNAQVFQGNIYGGYNTRESMGNIAVGGQIEDKPAANTSMNNNTTIERIIDTRELDFTEGTGIEPGDYSFMSAGTPIGTMPGGGLAEFNFTSEVKIEYANGNVDTNTFGITASNVDSIPSIIEANKKITIGENAVSGNVVLAGVNTLDTNPSGQRGFSNLRYDMVRLNKGDVF